MCSNVSGLWLKSSLDIYHNPVGAKWQDEGRKAYYKFRTIVQ
jgi:hypothetical protein